MNEEDAPRRCATTVLVGLCGRFLSSPLSRRAIVKAGWPSTSLCSLQTDSRAHSTNNAAVRALEMIPIMSSTRIVCSAGERWSTEVMMVGRMTCRKTGRRGGECGARGVLRMYVAR